MNWLWHGNSDVVFKTYDERKKGRIKKNALIFLVSGVVVMILTVFFFLLSFDFDVDNIIGSTGGVVKGEESEYVIKEVSGQKNILLYCTDDSDEKVKFLCAVKFNMDDKIIKVFPISTTEKIFTLNSKSVNATSCYKHAGVLQLVKSAGEYAGVDFDKYIGCKEGSIEGIVANFDELKITFPDDITLKSGVDSVSFSLGQQTISDDTVYKLLTYSSSGDVSTLRATVLIEMFKQYFNEAGIENRDEIYSNIISQVYSDISVVDFASYKDHIVVLSSDKVEKQYLITSTAEEFRE